MLCLSHACHPVIKIVHDLNEIMKKMYVHFIDMTKLIPPYLLCALCINHTPMSPATKTIKAHLCSATNPTIFPRKLKIAPTTLPTIAGNTSTAFRASLFSASASLSNHFFKTPSSFGGDSPVSTPPPKAFVTARTIVAIGSKY